MKPLPGSWALHEATRRPPPAGPQPLLGGNTTPSPQEEISFRLKLEGFNAAKLEREAALFSGAVAGVESAGRRAVF